MARGLLEIVLVALAAVLSARAEAAITIELRVDAEVRRDVAVHVSAKNIGDEPAEGVRPDARLLDATVQADRTVSVRPGFDEGWDLSLPRPTALGTFPLVIVLHYADAFGRRMSVPAVHQIRTTATTPSDVRLAIEPTPIVTAGTAVVRIENRETAAVTGTLATIASGDLAVEPARRAIEVAPGASIAVPLRVENRSALPGSTTMLWAYATLERGGWVETVIASGTIPIGDPSTTSVSPRIALVLAGVVVAALAAWSVRRWLAPRHAHRSRADRRRAR
jgi:hypothetical protein